MSPSAEEDAEALYQAMKGFGADHHALIAILCNRSNDHLQHVRDAYEKKYNSCLHRDVDAETSGAYQEALMGLLMTPAEYDVRCCRNAMKGTGCDEEELLEHMTHRTAAEMVAFDEKYLKVVGRTIQYDLKSELGGNLEKFFLALVEGTKSINTRPWTREELQRDAESLYQAGAGKLGCDAYTFIHILTTRNLDYRLALDDAYAKGTGDTLQSVIAKEFGGFLEKGLLALMTEHDEYYAKCINKALAGIGSDDAKLVRIVVSRRAQLSGINDAHKRLYNTGLRERIQTEVGGNLLKTMVSLTTGI